MSLETKREVMRARLNAATLELGKVQREVRLLEASIQLLDAMIAHDRSGETIPYLDFGQIELPVMHPEIEIDSNDEFDSDAGDR